MTVKDIDRGWKKILKNLKKEDKSYSKIGIQSNAGENDGVSIAEYAAANEFGTDKIPSRPFMRETYDKNLNKISLKVLSIQNDIYEGRKSFESGLKELGQWYEGIVKEAIKSGNWQANAPKTIEKKGSSKPLIDTGTMRNSIRAVEVFNGNDTI